MIGVGPHLIVANRRNVPRKRNTMGNDTLQKNADTSSGKKVPGIEKKGGASLE